MGAVATISTAGRRPVEASARRVLIVSNRLPFSAVERNGQIELRRSAGGLATALRQVHAQANTLWIGSLGPGDLASLNGSIDERLHSVRAANVAVSELEFAGFYRRYSNGVLWPALHGLECPSKADSRGWGMYQAVNKRFADAVASRWRPGDSIWVHDYQLMLLPSMLRERLPDARIGFFMHTSVASPDELAAVAEWPVLVNGILGADVVGFQTMRDASNFTDAADCAVSHEDDALVMNVADRDVRAIVCPIGVDNAWFASQSRDSAVASRCASLRAAAAGRLFVGVDRMDYTKGIPERLMAFERLLSEEPERRGNVRFIQVAVPSREGVGGYAELRQRVEAIVARINARFGTDSWTPVEYVYGGVDTSTLVALYRAADVMVVTPRRDGMNLVAKEFIAARTDGGGALVLSRTAGAAAELRSAVMVDADAVGSILEGYRRALTMSESETRSRMRRLRAAVAWRDVFAWAGQFLEALDGSPAETQS